jgi:hypothetical protein
VSDQSGNCRPSDLFRFASVDIRADRPEASQVSLSKLVDNEL